MAALWKWGFVPILLASIEMKFGYCSVTIKMQELVDEIKANASSETRPGLDYDSPMTVNITFYLEALTELGAVSLNFVRLRKS